MGQTTTKSTLEEAELGLAREVIWETFAPFTLPETADNRLAWRDGVKRQRKRIFKNFRRKVLGGKPRVDARTTEVIKDSYGPKWAEIGYGNYDPAKTHTNYTPWLWNGRRFLASTYGSARFRHLMLAALIEKLQPRSVLEVGCGNGINLLLLARRFPEIAFTGIELTDSGPELVSRLKASGGLPDNLAAYAPLPPRGDGKLQNLEVRQGSAEHLDAASGSFDLVFSVLALEQMERIRDKALSEMARVSAKWTLMIEPFRDVNRLIWPRLNIIRQDYFQGRISDLPRYGLEPQLVTDDFPQEIHLRACLVLSRKKGSETAAQPTIAA